MKKLFTIFTIALMVLLSVNSAYALAQCNDGVDNDDDTLVDFPSDPDCLNYEDNSEGVSQNVEEVTDVEETEETTSPKETVKEIKSKCSDGVDNDQDGFIDFPSDPGCVSANDNDEYNQPSNDDTSSLSSDTSVKEEVITADESSGGGGGGVPWGMIIVAAPLAIGLIAALKSDDKKTSGGSASGSSAVGDAAKKVAAKQVGNAAAPLGPGGTTLTSYAFGGGSLWDTVTGTVASKAQEAAIKEAAKTVPYLGLYLQLKDLTIKATDLAGDGTDCSNPGKTLAGVKKCGFIQIDQSGDKGCNVNGDLVLDGKEGEPQDFTALVQGCDYDSEAKNRVKFYGKDIRIKKGEEVLVTPASTGGVLKLTPEGEGRTANTYTHMDPKTSKLKLDEQGEIEEASITVKGLEEGKTASYVLGGKQYTGIPNGAEIKYNKKTGYVTIDKIEKGKEVMVKGPGSDGVNFGNPEENNNNLYGLKAGDDTGKIFMKDDLVNLESGSVGLTLPGRNEQVTLGATSPAADGTGGASATVQFLDEKKVKVRAGTFETKGADGTDLVSFDVKGDGKVPSKNVVVQFLDEGDDLDPVAGSSFLAIDSKGKKAELKVVNGGEITGVSLFKSGDTSVPSQEFDFIKKSKFSVSSGVSGIQIDGDLNEPGSSIAQYTFDKKGKRIRSNYITAKTGEIEKGDSRFHIKKSTVTSDTQPTRISIGPQKIGEKAVSINSASLNIGERIQKSKSLEVASTGDGAVVPDTTTGKDDTVPNDLVTAKPAVADPTVDGESLIGTEPKEALAFFNGCVSAMSEGQKQTEDSLKGIRTQCRNEALSNVAKKPSSTVTTVINTPTPEEVKKDPNAPAPVKIIGGESVNEVGPLGAEERKNKNADGSVVGKAGMGPADVDNKGEKLTDNDLLDAKAQEALGTMASNLNEGGFVFDKTLRPTFEDTRLFGGNMEQVPNHKVSIGGVDYTVKINKFLIGDGTKGKAGYVYPSTSLIELDSDLDGILSVQELKVQSTCPTCNTEAAKLLLKNPKGVKLTTISSTLEGAVLDSGPVTVFDADGNAKQYTGAGSFDPNRANAPVSSLGRDTNGEAALDF